MAYDRTKLERQSGGIQKLFSYKTDDAIATVTGSGYFSAEAPVLDKGDIIIVASDMAGTPKVDVVMVTSARGVVPVTTTATEGVTAT